MKYVLLKAYQVIKSVDQEEMAKILGITTRTYQNKINGITPFTLDEAKTISDFFGKSIEQIFFANDVN